VREETMPTPPAVLILDDGELDDVQALLQECEIPFARIRGGAIVQGSPPPRDLLIATPRHIDAVGEAIGDSINPPVRVMVVNEDSNALREQLRRNGFDYLVRRPVHNEALRLMLLHCVYKGEERRSDPRVAVGFEVTVRTGMLSRRATLVDLSIRGCRLQTRHRVEKGKRIKVLIPEALEAGEPITVLGHVMRLEGDKSEGEDLYRLGIQFEVADRDTLQALQPLIDDLSRGPATLRVGADQVPRPTVPSAPDVRVADRAAAKPEAREAELGSDAPGDEGARAERRRAKRARYSQTVPAFGDRALRVLVGRDLSVGGMRVQRESGLEIGRRLHLAIYGEAGEEPLLVWSTVDRDDGDEGLFVLFDAIDREAGKRLERMVADLPTIESLHDSEAQAMGTVLSEIVDAANPSGSLPA
jgi:hypothetical protein